jgi:hypothetical protein
VAVIEGALPLRGTRDARFPQGQHRWHGDYACRQNLSSPESLTWRMQRRYPAGVIR